MRLKQRCKCQSLEIVRPILPVPRSTRIEVLLAPSPKHEYIPRRRKCRRSFSRAAREHGVNELEFMSKRSILLPYNFSISRKPLPTVPPVTPNSEFSFECKFEILPKKFPDLKDLEIPIVRDNGVKLSIELLGEYFKCTDYQYSFLQYWFLDVMVDCIWRAQDDFGFSVEEQKYILSWVLFFFDLIRDPRNYSREEFFGIFRETIDIAVELMTEGDCTMYHPIKIMEINSNERSLNTDVISERYSTPSAIITPRTSQTKDSEGVLKKCPLHCNDFDSDSNEDCMCYEKLCQNSLRPSSNEQESQYIPKVLRSKHEDEEESSSESFSSSIHGESVPDYDFLDYLNSCDPYPENLESLYSDLHFEHEDLQKYKILPLKYGKDIPAFILFSPSLVSSSEDSNQPSTDKKSSTTDSKTTSVPTTISDASIPLMPKLTMYKVMEQRVRDYMDSNVGLSSWQMRSDEEVEANIHRYDDAHYGEEQYEGNEEEEQSSIHSQELEILQDKHLKDNFQYTLIKMALTVEPNLIVQDFNDEWHTPKHLTEDLTLYVKDLKDKYKKIIKKQKKTKEKKEKTPKEKTEKKGKSVKEKKEKKPKEKKGLTEEEKLEKQRLAELEAERIKRDIHDKFMFPLQDAIADDEFFLEKFPNWKKVNWRKGK